MREPIPGLTGLRFIAALSVVLGHAIPKLAPFADPLRLVLVWTLAAEGMSLFFVLSGFVIFYNYSETIRGAGGVYNFIVARFARLYPLYFIGVTYDLLMKVAYYQLPENTLAALPYYATLTQSWIYHPIGGAALIYQFGLIPMVSWSISTEWFFYLTFPMVCLAIAHLTTIKSRLCCAAILIVIAYLISAIVIANSSSILAYGLETYGPVGGTFQDSFYRWLIYFSPYARLPEFLLGCLAASIYMKLKASPSAAEARCGAWLTGAALISFALLHWVMFGVQSERAWYAILQSMHMNFGFAPLSAIFIFCCARYRNSVTNLMASPWLVLCGEASYSLYLLHSIVINKFGLMVPAINDDPRIAMGAVIQVALVTLTCIGLSLVTWSIIEVPARRTIRRALAISPQATITRALGK
jgi:peptidoglycan/LPS O-acetylase OafA/YrhL